MPLPMKASAADQSGANDQTTETGVMMTSARVVSMTIEEGSEQSDSRPRRQPPRITVAEAVARAVALRRDDGFVRLSIEAIASAVGRSRRQAMRMIRSAERRGEVAVRRLGGRAGSLYRSRAIDGAVAEGQQVTPPALAPGHAAATVIELPVPEAPAAEVPAPEVPPVPVAEVSQAVMAVDPPAPAEELPRPGEMDPGADLFGFVAPPLMAEREPQVADFFARWDVLAVAENRARDSAFFPRVRKPDDTIAKRFPAAVLEAPEPFCGIKDGAMFADVLFAAVLRSPWLMGETTTDPDEAARRRSVRSPMWLLCRHRLQKEFNATKALRGDYGADLADCARWVLGKGERPASRGPMSSAAPRREQRLPLPWDNGTRARLAEWFAQKIVATRGADEARVALARTLILEHTEAWKSDDEGRTILRTRRDGMKGFAAQPVWEQFLDELAEANTQMKRARFDWNA